MAIDMTTDSTQFQGSASPYINIAPRSLAAQRLSPASYPDEAEIFCSFMQCNFGLTRGLVVGGDVLGMAYSPFRQYLDPNWISGSLYVVDAFGGFQILRDVNAKSFMNAQLGYRRIGFNDDTNNIVSEGFTVQVNYAQLITPVYLQGMSFSSFFTAYSSLNNQQALPQSSPSHAKFANSASYFYRVSQKYPTYRVSFPADVEVANWGPDQTHLAAPLRTYVHLEPFYIQNNLNFSYDNASILEKEQNFGITLAGTVSYESTEKSEFGRHALLGSLGLNFQTSDFRTTQHGNAQLDLPGRKPVAPYVNLAGSWEF